MTDAEILDVACVRLLQDHNPRYALEIGLGRELLCHEILHYALAMGRAPALRGERAPIDITVLVSIVLDARYDEFHRDALDRNERRTLAASVVLGERFECTFDVDEIAKYAVENQNVTEPDPARLADEMRRLRSDKRVLRAVEIAEKYLRDMVKFESERSVEVA